VDVAFVYRDGYGLAVAVASFRLESRSLKIRGERNELVTFLQSPSPLRNLGFVGAMSGYVGDIVSSGSQRSLIPLETCRNKDK
jgi:hypothetical protein